jgi:hypothetical protein
LLFINVDYCFDFYSDSKLDREFTHGHGGMVHAMVSWEPISIKEKSLQVTPHGLGSNSTNKTMPTILLLVGILELYEDGGGYTHWWKCDVGLLMFGVDC